MKLNRMIETVFRGVSRLLFPPSCAVCRSSLGTEGEHDICLKCREGIQLKNGYSCRVCGEPIEGEVAAAGIIICGNCRITPPPFDATVYGVRYSGSVKKLIHRYKFGGKTGLAPLLSSLLCAELYRDPLAREADIVVPVPLHRKRIYARGFNQAYLIALEVGRALSKPVEAGILGRVKSTSPQSERSRKERSDNIKRAFAVAETADVSGKTVILVDDIMTTGATLAEASRVLKKAGASKILCAVCARA